MGNSRAVSFLFSFCLHAGLFALILWWPASNTPLLDISAPINVGIVTIGGPNAGPPMASGPLKPDTTKAPEALSPNLPTPPAKPQTLPSKPEPVVTPPPPSKPDPIKTPDTTPAKPVAEAPVQPKPDAIPIKDPKAPETAPKTPDKTPEKPTAQKPAAPAKPDPNAAANALKDLQNATGQKPGGTSGGRTDPNAAANALKELGKEYGAGGSGSGAGSGGGDGIGVLGSYKDSVSSRILANREGIKSLSNRKLVSIYAIDIATDGTITGARLLQSSGDGLYDAMNMRAIQKTKMLEPPPNKKPLYNYEVEFVPDE